MYSHNPADSILLTGWALQAVCPAPCTTSRLFGYKNSQAGLRKWERDGHRISSLNHLPISLVCACLEDWTEGAFGHWWREMGTLVAHVVLE